MIDRRLFLAAPLGLGLTARASAAPLPKVAVIPIKRLRDMPTVTLTIGGRGPFTLVLASANGLSLTMDDAVLAPLKLEVISGTSVRELNDPDPYARRSLPVYAAHDLLIGGVAQQKAARIIGRSEIFGGQGIMPARLLTEHQSVLDFENGMMLVYAEGVPDRTGFARAPYIPQNYNQLIVDGEFEGRRVKLRVNTGAQGGLILNSHYVEANRLWQRTGPAIELLNPYDPRRTPFRQIKAESFKVGPYRFHDPIVTLTPPEHNDAEDYDGSIGIDLLRRFTIGFDGDDHNIWLKPNRSIGEFYRYDRSGMAAHFYADKQEAVVLRAEGAAAKAGLQVGDRVAGISSAESLRNLAWRLTNPAGETVEVEVLRAGQPQTIKIILEDRL